MPAMMNPTSSKVDAPADQPAHKGKRWSPDEELQLADAFKAGASVKDLAILHGRSVSAITSRLQLMDLLVYGPYTALVTGTYPPELQTEPKPDPEGGAPHDTPAESDKNPWGKPWTEDETARLLVTHHSLGTPEALVELGAELDRSARALALKLVQLGAVQAELNPNPKPQPRPEPKPSKASAKTGITPPAASGKTLKITVTPEFQTANTAIQNGENLLILGSAGTGKSTFLKWLRRQLQDKKRYAVLAPTGMAALNVGGQTIHSFFGFKAQLITGSDGWHKPRNPKVFENLDLLVIDEISMVRADIFDGIERFLRKYGKRPGSPFGGVQIVLMGDLCQLPPVVRRDEAAHFETLFETPFFFSSPAWEAGNFGIIEFTHIFRQTDLPFINLLNEIRHGSRDSGVIDALNRRLTPTPPAGAVILAARNRTVDDINQRELEKLTFLPRTYMAKVSGDADPNAFTTPIELVLKPGARVMFTRNDINQRWVNGSLGEVLRCDTETVTVKLDTGETHIVEPVKWEATKYKFDEETQAPQPSVAGTFTQIPLTLAWALTIHKAQGQTLANCVIDLSDGGAFAEGQLYVALSRARSLEGLHLTQPVQQKDIRTAPAVLGFYSDLRQARGNTLFG